MKSVSIKQFFKEITCLYCFLEVSFRWHNRIYSYTPVHMKTLWQNKVSTNIVKRKANKTAMSLGWNQTSYQVVKRPSLTPSTLLPFLPHLWSFYSPSFPKMPPALTNSITISKEDRIALCSESSQPAWASMSSQSHKAIGAEDNVCKAWRAQHSAWNTHGKCSRWPF